MFGPSEFCSEWLVASVCVLGHLQAQANAEIHPWMRRLSHPVWNMGCKHTNTHIHTGTSSFARNTEYKADKQRQKQVNLKLSSQIRCRLLHPARLCTRRNTKQSVTAIFERRFFSATNHPPNTFKMWCILILKMIFMLTKDVRWNTPFRSILGERDAKSGSERGGASPRPWVGHPWLLFLVTATLPRVRQVYRLRARLARHTIQNWLSVKLGRSFWRSLSFTKAALTCNNTPEDQFWEAAGVWGWF